MECCTLFESITRRYNNDNFQVTFCRHPTEIDGLKPNFFWKVMYLLMMLTIVEQKTGKPNLGIGGVQNTVGFLLMIATAIWKEIFGKTKKSTSRANTNLGKNSHYDSHIKNTMMEDFWHCMRQQSQFMYTFLI